ncbi:UNVERIFIED_CONTAM: hypothetical protein FKN15_019884 [Acipenser sinensis]
MAASTQRLLSFVNIKNVRVILAPLRISSVPVHRYGAQVSDTGEKITHTGQKWDEAKTVEHEGNAAGADMPSLPGWRSTPREGAFPDWLQEQFCKLEAENGARAGTLKKGNQQRLARLEQPMGNSRGGCGEQQRRRWRKTASGEQQRRLWRKTASGEQQTRLWRKTASGEQQRRQWRKTASVEQQRRPWRKSSGRAARKPPT